MTSSSKNKGGRPRASTTYTAFGTSVSQSLAGANLTRPEFASALNTTESQVSHLLLGMRKPAPKWVDLIADTLNLSEAERKDLHLKAARQYGFKL